MNGRLIRGKDTFAVKLTLMELVSVSAMACATAKSAVRRGFQDINNEALTIEEKVNGKLNRMMWTATAYAEVPV